MLLGWLEKIEQSWREPSIFYEARILAKVYKRVEFISHDALKNTGAPIKTVSVDSKRIQVNNTCTL